MTDLRTIARPLAFYTGALCLAPLLAYLGRWSWVCDLLVNFRVHFAGLLGIALIMALVIRRWHIAGVAALGLALNVWPMQDAFLGTAAPPMPNARAVRVAEFNVQIGNEDLAGVAEYLDSQSVDVVVLAELPVNEQQLAALFPQMPHRYLAEPDGVWGVAILSRWPLIGPRAAKEGGMPFAALVEVNLGDRRFWLYGAHLNWPVTPDSARVRNAQLRALGREMVLCPDACVAVGDFNVTPWSSHFRELLKPGVRDCAAGRGLLNTWSSRLPVPLRIRIDQCLAAGAVSVAGARVGESIGSDHFATIYDLLIGGR